MSELDMDHFLLTRPTSVWTQPYPTHREFKKSYPTHSYS